MRLHHILFLVLILSLIAFGLTGCQTTQESEYYHVQEGDVLVFGFPCCHHINPRYFENAIESISENEYIVHIHNATREIWFNIENNSPKRITINEFMNCFNEDGKTILSQRGDGYKGIIYHDSYFLCGDNFNCSHEFGEVTYGGGEIIAAEDFIWKPSKIIREPLSITIEPNSSARYFNELFITDTSQLPLKLTCELRVLVDNYLWVKSNKVTITYVE
ncbi:MAG: hypothetical protein KJ767_03360 [Nanoarchaeota archaeon]|nr:hypothetical protein [Nanoarchaeota archaeon]